ncbi:glutathione S-transferase family protein [Thiomonas intermedia]|uniref:glutathione S-transferase family protein n=1 Tax=Thiomonas intermedia TaxID=926 RepID=UPI0009A49444|nr:glutathione S-transferase family protein [Thiomonas intermedia]
MFILHIGNKNYSSWSMRPWVAMTAFGIPFEERQHWLDTPAFAAQVPLLSPVARVPILEDGALRIWDTLAIGEYLAERFPQHALWPRDAAARARARSLCASMHSGFAALREHMVMNIEADLPGRGWNPAVQRDIDQILLMWQSALQTSGGPFLFGAFGVADAFYAPVCMRFLTYRPELPDWAWAYVQAVADHPAVARWTGQARAEHVFLPADEPYRSEPDRTA